MYPSIYSFILYPLYMYAFHFILACCNPPLRYAELHFIIHPIYYHCAGPRKEAMNIYIYIYIYKIYA